MGSDKSVVRQHHPYNVLADVEKRTEDASATGRIPSSNRGCKSFGYGLGSDGRARRRSSGGKHLMSAHLFKTLIHTDAITWLRGSGKAWVGTAVPLRQVFASRSLHPPRELKDTTPTNIHDIPVDMVTLPVQNWCSQIKGEEDVCSEEDFADGCDPH